MPNIRIALNSEKVNRLKEYLNWIDPKDSIESDYWKEHSSLINIKFDKNSVLLSGESGFFFANNRVEKWINGEPIRFSEYPWRSYTRTVFFEIDPFYRLVQLEPIFIRLEQYL